MSGPTDAGGTAAVVLLPRIAHAHLVNTGLGPFYDGVSHFALTPEDVLPAVALALLAGQRGSLAARRALFVLPLGWLLGGVVGLAFPTIGESPALTTASFLATGGLVAAEARLGPGWVTALAASLGLLHGYLNGSSLSRPRPVLWVSSASSRRSSSPSRSRRRWWWRSGRRGPGSRCASPAAGSPRSAC